MENIFDKFKKQTKDRNVIKVLMMGGRRCGKTSVLASMDKCCKERLREIDGLSVTCEEGGLEISTKLEELKRYFTERFMKRMTFEPDLKPSPAAQEYDYKVKIHEKDVDYTLRFQDFPGEWLKTHENDDQILQWFKESHVIIIAIDTPHLVEEPNPSTGVGKYHSVFNRVEEIYSFLKRAFVDGVDSKLVIFVPLKCEKYYYRNEMANINELVKKGYSDLIGFLGSPDVKAKCAVAITPILSLGGAEFFEFNYEKEEFKEVGYAGVYNYVRDTSLRDYLPKYCEQPLFLTLNYLLGIYRKKMEKNGTIIEWILTTLFNKIDLDSLASCETIVKENIIRDAEKGFEIIQDPMGLME